MQVKLMRDYFTTVTQRRMDVTVLRVSLQSEASTKQSNV